MPLNYTLARLLLLAALFLAHVPVLVSNYESLSRLPAQILFAVILAVPAILFVAVAGWFPSLWMILVPGVLALVLHALVLQIYYTSTSSTTAIVLYLIPAGQAVIFLVAAPLTLLVIKLGGG